MDLGLLQHMYKSFPVSISPLHVCFRISEIFSSLNFSVYQVIWAGKNVHACLLKFALLNSSQVYSAKSL